MPSSKQKLGTLAEQAGADFLRQRGFSVLGMHISTRYGEIDILCQDGTTLVAAEVKIRRSDRFGRAIEGMTEKKLERLAAALQTTAENMNLPGDDLRIDLLALDPGKVPGTYSVAYFPAVG